MTRFKKKVNERRKLIIGLNTLRKRNWIHHCLKSCLINDAIKGMICGKRLQKRKVLTIFKRKDDSETETKLKRKRPKDQQRIVEETDTMMQLPQGQTFILINY